MLTEQFIASIGAPTKTSGVNAPQDAIFVHEYQPLHAQRSTFKKSSTPPNCLAVTATHVFAAQTDKAVVHVYSRLKGNHEATVPFTERISCIALACDDTVLALGTMEGRLFLWETASGRQVTTAQLHLQAVTALAVDPTSNFLLSASADSTLHVWSLPPLLSFATVDVQTLSPLRTFASHREGVTALSVGHSSSFCNFAVSVAQDKTCLVWDFHSGDVLRTYLLPSKPTCLVLDVADRCGFVGYEDGSLQQLDFYVGAGASGNGLASIHARGVDVAPIQLPESSLFSFGDKSDGAALSISLSFAGDRLLSGHQSGAIMSWDVSRRQPGSRLLQAPLSGPVTNLSFLPVTGFQHERARKLTVPAVVKPRFGAFDHDNGNVPENYSMSVQLGSAVLDDQDWDFEQMLAAPTFPEQLLSEGLVELAGWDRQSHAHVHEAEHERSADFMALDDGAQSREETSLKEQNACLKEEVEALRRLQKASFEKIDKINAEKKLLMLRAQKRVDRSDPGTSRSTNGHDLKDSESED